ncbi:hypothetical protein AB0945_25320 [Streptomyces sp. NPDC005474]|uniref:hypothetical protein n=1 Tax=Streptomyces sp. NPDC005474 TaxID=3154878 RepID=UPI0034570D57
MKHVAATRREPDDHVLGEPAVFLTVAPLAGVPHTVGHPLADPIGQPVQLHVEVLSRRLRAVGGFFGPFDNDRAYGAHDVGSHRPGLLQLRLRRGCVQQYQAISVSRWLRRLTTFAIGSLDQKKSNWA